MADTNFDTLVLDKQPKVVAPDATNMTGAYVQADVQKLVVLCNELKAKLNAICKG